MIRPVDAGRARSSGSAAEPIVVACAADASYVMPLAVMLTSLVEHLDPRRPLDVYVVDGGTARDERTRLSGSLTRANVRMHWIPARPDTLPELPVWGRFSPSVYQRLQLPELLPESVRKAIWLDCDLVVLRDLAELWEVDVIDRYAAAVQDVIVPYVSSSMGVAHHAELGIPASAPYFNAGVMLVNLVLWRKDDVAGRVCKYLQEYEQDVVFLEQEGLNAVLFGKWVELDPRWNQNAGVVGKPFFRARHLDETTYRRIVRDPWIVHFGGNVKPWLVRRETPLTALYFRYLDLTPWAGWRPKRTLSGLLLGTYASSHARNVLYPAEGWALELVRRLTRRRLVTGARGGRSDDS